MIRITGNQPLDYFIMESNEKLEKVMNLFSQSSEKYINNLLIHLNLDSRDFTDSDWKIIEQYIWNGEKDDE